MSEPKSFTVHISDQAISDLNQRLDLTRWPDQVDDVGWTQGAELNYLRELVQYWRNEFDWRAQEAKINQLDQFTLEFDGLTTHFIHQRSPHANARPLLLNHGWPGSIIEFLDVIPRLTQPEKFGGRAEDAFHVVAPSLPGYGFSEAAHTLGMNTRAIAARHVELMKRLGYERFICQGGDWGAMITRQLADLAPEHCEAIHLNMVLAGPIDKERPMEGVTEAEIKRVEEDAAFSRSEMGYFKIQATKPQSLGYALNDSPVGLCGWLTEKFQRWTDCQGEIRNAVSWDTLLANISWYWFSGSITSAMRLYYEHRQHKDTVQKISVPTGAAIYPVELYRPPKAWVEATYNLVHWHEAGRGGHFAALEQPQDFVEDIWRFRSALED
ncbi:microsomal epoxide hydrolase [Litorivivens lipolytica]|uniref:Microsomal epoxide hydrolase n=1 Tax=Litorivivens lipolytica TaxID=1524264 RepID=A0A7W4W585_9GAMM|nr:epoxide hydrolase family protein [Litorivivens lipolytica]MBB3047711.1 microsomal epoxide hydrolase [Litorivivens lipolytica]